MAVTPWAVPWALLAASVLVAFIGPLGAFSGWLSARKAGEPRHRADAGHRGRAPRNAPPQPPPAKHAPNSGPR